MIRILRRAVAPRVLTDNRDAWLRAATLEIASGKTFNETSVANKYNQPEVKTMLLADCKSKCMYCESKITHVDFGDIEHIKPKVPYDTEAFDWTNLGLACARCNVSKSNYYLPTPVIDPYAEKPEDFIFSDGQLIYGKPANDKGQVSILKLKLNRPELLEQRKRKMDDIYNLVDRAARSADEGLKTALLAQADSLVDSESEYSFVSASFLQGLKRQLGL